LRAEHASASRPSQQPIRPSRARAPFDFDLLHPITFNVGILPAEDRHVANVGYYIRFRQTSSSQSAFDTYGMKWLNLQYGIAGGTDIRFENLPTTAPSENGRVWNNNGILYIVFKKEKFIH
jgi:hypothetical protein